MEYYLTPIYIILIPVILKMVYGGEHILLVKEYRDIIESKGYKLTVLPAFWDTHYGNFF